MAVFVSKSTVRLHDRRRMSGLRPPASPSGRRDLPVRPPRSTATQRRTVVASVSQAQGLVRSRSMCVLRRAPCSVVLVVLVPRNIVSCAHTAGTQQQHADRAAAPLPDRMHLQIRTAFTLQARGRRAEPAMRHPAAMWRPTAVENHGADSPNLREQRNPYAKQERSEAK